MDKIKDMLDEEIKAEIINLSTLSPGSKDKTAALSELATLYKLRIEETKNEMDIDEKSKRRAMEMEQMERDVADRQIQLSEQVKDRYFKLGIAAAEIILPMVFYAIWMKRGFRFEETGTYTSTTFRGLFNRFKPTK